MKCLAVCLSVALLSLGHAGQDEPEPCGGASSALLEAGSCLVFEDNGQFGDDRNLVERVVRQTVSSVNDLMPVDDVRIRVGISLSQTIPEIGIGGYASSGHEVLIFIDPYSSAVPASLETDLASALAHELHHAKRKRTVGYGLTLFEAAVSEGLADHFAKEVTGKVPIWSEALTGDDLARWTARLVEAGAERLYAHGGWFFGTDPDIPRWTGYAVGFELVRAYLSANPDRRASGLADEPATTFLPTSSER